MSSEISIHIVILRVSTEACNEKTAKAERLCEIMTDVITGTQKIEKWNFSI